MDQIKEKIDAAICGLSEIITRSDGQSLQDVHNSISDLTNLMDSSAWLIQGDNGNLFTHIKDPVAAAIENLEDLHRVIGENMSIFPKASGLLGEL